MAAHDVEFGFRIEAPHFVASVTVSPILDQIIRAAPIVGYMKGWSVKQVADYCKKKGWRFGGDQDINP